MKHFIFLVFLIFHYAFCQNLYQRVLIREDLQDHRLHDLGLCLDHVTKTKEGIIAELHQDEVSLLQQRKLKYDILVYDLEKFYEQQIYSSVSQKTAAVGCNPAPNYTDPSNFSLGSMGGYFTYDEILANLDSMRAKFPQYISAKAATSSEVSHQGRPIYYVRISDNPDIDENEPEMLYTALHHAREAASVSQLLYFMWYLLENAQNPEISHILQNTELYFIPCVNPDGYVHNEMTNPAGGGMWRKNRRPMLNNTFGVDLNRNYGMHWGYDNLGSSPDSTKDTYRGPSAFSEPETRAIRDFCIAHDFQITINYHTYGNLLIYPWGYIAGFLTPDSTVFREYGKLLTTYNGYLYGTGDETVGYVTNGDSDDWMYGEQTLKNKSFSMSPEIGSQNDGFWPSQSRILPLCRENVFPNLTAAQLLLKYETIKNLSPKFVSSPSYHYKYQFTRMGLEDGGNFSVNFTALTPNIQSISAANSYNNPPLMFQKTDSVQIQLNSGVLPGEILQFAVTVSNGTFSHTDTITQYFYGGTLIFASDCNSLTGWVTTSWGVKNGTLTESVGGNYPNNTTRTLTTQFFDASNADALLIKFDAKWDIEKNYDYLIVQISDSSSPAWQNLCGLYSRTGTGYQLQGEPVYDGQSSWVQENFIVPTNIFAFHPNKVRLRFRFVSDGGVTGGGFELDNVEIRKITYQTTDNQEIIDKKVSIFPNPFHQILHYRNVPENSKFILFNHQGQAVFTNDINQNGWVELPAMPKGFYYYQILNSSQALISGKLIKE